MAIVDGRGPSTEGNGTGVSLDRENLIRALPSYEIEGELGRGAFGLVLAGRHRQLDRPVAIKQLPQAFAADPEVRRRFTAEARVLASMDHPHIVRVFDYVERDGLCVLVMEYLPGGSVRSQQLQGITPQQACAIGLATCAALDYAHERGVLHRDIKPDNLLFTQGRMLKVTDFGIAKVLGQTMATRAGEAIGTPAYMSPEQCLGRELGPATDLYSTGVMLYELLAGRLPYPEEGDALSLLYRHVHEAPRPLAAVARGVPEGVAYTVMRALAKDPSERHPSAESLGVALAESATAAWGVGWLSAAGVKVMAIGPIHTATETAPQATTTGAGPRPFGLAPPLPPGRAAPPPGPFVAANAGASSEGAGDGRRRRLLAGAAVGAAAAAIAAIVFILSSSGHHRSPAANASAVAGGDAVNSPENVTFYYEGGVFRITHISAGGGNYVIAVDISNPTQEVFDTGVGQFVLTDGQSPVTPTLGGSISSVPSGASASGTMTFEIPTGFDPAKATLTAGETGREETVDIPIGSGGKSRLLSPTAATSLAGPTSVGPDRITLTAGELRFDDPVEQVQAPAGQAIVQLTYKFACQESESCLVDSSSFLLTPEGGPAAGSSGSSMTANVDAGATAGGFDLFFPVPVGVHSYTLALTYEDNNDQSFTVRIPVAFG
jgi:Protein kinase domain